jgi:plastocyanin
MKFSAAVTLGIAPLALAKAVHNKYPVRRDRGGANVGVDPSVLESMGIAGVGIQADSLTEVILIWVNGGGGAATTTINAQQTVTQTVTVNGGSEATAAAPPPGETASTTVAAGSSTVVSGATTTHTVTVGGPKGLAYEPNTIEAAVGYMVIFTFLSQNHTATQSAFTTPCKLLAGGMDSGFQPNPNNSVNPPPQVAMQVMVSTPLCKSNRSNEIT